MKTLLFTSYWDGDLLGLRLVDRYWRVLYGDRSHPIFIQDVVLHDVLMRWS
jgi:hypothetical protein